MKYEGSALRKIVNSYLLAHEEEPYEDLDLLKSYLKRKMRIKVSEDKLKKYIDDLLKKRKKKEELEELESRLFTKDGNPREYKYGSAFCSNCNMYKDHEKECPYCGSLEMTF